MLPLAGTLPGFATAYERGVVASPFKHRAKPNGPRLVRSAHAPNTTAPLSTATAAPPASGAAAAAGVRFSESPLLTYKHQTRRMRSSGAVSNATPQSIGEIYPAPPTYCRGCHARIDTPPTGDSTTASSSAHPHSHPVITIRPANGIHTPDSLLEENTRLRLLLDRWSGVEHTNQLLTTKIQLLTAYIRDHKPLPPPPPTQPQPQTPVASVPTATQRERALSTTAPLLVPPPAQPLMLSPRSGEEISQIGLLSLDDPTADEPPTASVESASTVRHTAATASFDKPESDSAAPADPHAPIRAALAEPIDTANATATGDVPAPTAGDAAPDAAPTTALERTRRQQRVEGVHRSAMNRASAAEHVSALNALLEMKRARMASADVPVLRGFADVIERGLAARPPPPPSAIKSSKSQSHDSPPTATAKTTSPPTHLSMSADSSVLRRRLERPNSAAPSGPLAISLSTSDDTHQLLTPPAPQSGSLAGAAAAERHRHFSLTAPGASVITRSDGDVKQQQQHQPLSQSQTIRPTTTVGGGVSRAARMLALSQPRPSTVPNQPAGASGAGSLTAHLTDTFRSLHTEFFLRDQETKQLEIMTGRAASDDLDSAAGGSAAPLNHRLLHRMESVSSDVWHLQREVSRWHACWAKARAAHESCGTIHADHATQISALKQAQQKLSDEKLALTRSLERSAYDCNVVRHAYEQYKSEAERKLSASQLALTALNTRFTASEEELKRTRDELRSVSDSLTETRAVKQRFFDENTGYVETIKHLEAAKDALTAVVRDARTESGAAQSTIHTMKTGFDAAMNKLAAQHQSVLTTAQLLKDENIKFRTDIDQWKVAYKTQTDNLSIREGELVALTKSSGNRIVGLEQEIKTFLKRERKSADELKQLSTAYADVVSSHETCDSTIAQLRTELASTQQSTASEIERLKSAAAQNDKLYADESAQLKSVTERLKELESRLSHDSAQYEATIRSVRESHSKCDSVIAGLHAEVYTATSQLATKTAALEVSTRIQREVTSEHAKCKGMAEEITRLTEAVAVRETAIDERDKYKLSLLDLTVDYQRAVSVHQHCATRLSELQSRFDQLTATHQSCIARAAELVSVKADLAEANKSFKQVEFLSKKLSDSHIELSAIRQSHRFCDDKILNLQTEMKANSEAAGAHATLTASQIAGLTAQIKAEQHITSELTKQIETLRTATPQARAGSAPTASGGGGGSSGGGSGGAGTGAAGAGMRYDDVFLELKDETHRAKLNVTQLQSELSQMRKQLVDAMSAHVTCGETKQKLESAAQAAGDEMNLLRVRLAAATARSDELGALLGEFEQWKIDGASWKDEVSGLKEELKMRDDAYAFARRTFADLKPYVGVDVDTHAVPPALPSQAAMAGAAGGTGLLVRDVIAGSPAHACGLTVGDIILEFNEKPVRTRAEFIASMSGAKSGVLPGDIVPLRFVRTDSKGMTATHTVPFQMGGKGVSITAVIALRRFAAIQLNDLRLLETVPGMELLLKKKPKRKPATAAATASTPNASGSASTSATASASTTPRAASAIAVEKK